MRDKKILVIGHPLIVDVNREVWASLARQALFGVDIVLPNSWRSNLIKRLSFERNATDQVFSNIFPLNCFKEGSGSFYFFNPLSLFKVLNSNKYEKIILTQETWSFSLAILWIVKFFTKNQDTLIFLWVCQNIKKQHFYFLRFFERLITTDVQRVLGCCTEAIEVVNWKQLNVEKYYFPFSVNEKRFQLTEKTNTVINIGYIGRLSEEKGIQEILNAVDFFQKNKRIQFHFAGAGDFQEVIEKKTNIKFHGVLRHNEVNHFYKNMHVILIPSKTKSFWKEQFGRVIVEGVASGAIVIGSDSGAIPEVMKLIGLEEYVFPEGNFEQFISKINKAIEVIQLGYDANEYAKKALEVFGHENVAKLIEGYIMNPEDQKGRVNAEGKIDGFL